MSQHAVFGLTVCVVVISICVASVKGCQRVYDPASIKADAEARVMLHKELTK